MIHVPMSGASRCISRAATTSSASRAPSISIPMRCPAWPSSMETANDVFYLSIPRAFLASAGTSLNGALREIVPITPQWRLLLRYAQSLHEELALLPPERDHDLFQPRP